MKRALAWSLAAHLALITAADVGSRLARPRGDGPQFIDVSLVTFSTPAVAAGVGESATEVAPPPTPVAPPSVPPEADTESPLPETPWVPPAGESVPEIAEFPREEPEPAPPPAEPEERASETPSVVRKSPLKQITSPSTKQDADAGETRITGPPRSAPSAGVGTGAITLDTESFHFSYYLSALRNKIAGHWSPAALGGSEEPLSATVYFRITRNGVLEGVKVEKSSGNQFFDQSALRAVLASSPLAPLPREFTEPSLGVHFEFLQYP